MKHYSFPRTLLHTICRASLLLLLAAACTNDNPADDPNADGERVTVEFLVPGVTSVGSDGQTRAASALPEGATVRILAADVNTLYGNQAYYVKGGRLVPCTVDDNGKFIAEDPNGKMALKPAKYSFGVCTPALKMTLDAYETPCVTVLQNMDYATSITQERTIAFTGAVTLDPLNHECARLQLVMNSDDAAITAMTAKSATLTGFSDDKLETALGHPFYTSIGSGTKSATTTAFVQDAVNPKLSTADLFLLPCSIAAPVKATYEIAYTVLGIERTETVSADLPKLTLTKGKSYTLTANFAKDGGIHLSISDWDQNGQDNSMGEGTYPYVKEGKYIVSRDQYGGSKAKAIHEHWFQTPEHTDATVVNGIQLSESVAACLEVDKSDKYAVWGSTNSGCTAPWRRPTIAEAEMIHNVRGQLLPAVVDGFRNSWYYTATQTSGDATIIAAYQYEGRRSTVKTNVAAYYRCVRDIFTSNTYPYVVQGAYIVSKDAGGSSGATLHPNWSSTPGHNDATVTDGIQIGESVAARFQVSDGDLGYLVWESTNGRCDVANSWRRPTIKELELISQVHSQLTVTDKFDNHLTNGNWYHSATMSSTVSGSSCTYKFGQGRVTVPTGAQTWQRCVKDF